MKNNKNKNKQGFTLIELLIVVLIISILAGLLLSVINPIGIRKKTRDSQRKSDLKRIQTALELYYADYRAYPLSTNYVVAGASGTAVQTALANNVNGNYLNEVPRDPKGLEGDTTYQGAFSCGSTKADYSYRSDATGSSYVLVSTMEVDTSASESTCGSLNNSSVLNCSTTQPNCYGVENP